VLLAKDTGNDDVTFSFENSTFVFTTTGAGSCV
jgi:hypothetical protein